MNQAIADRAKTVRADQTQGKQLQVVPILGPSHTDPAYEMLRPETLSRVRIAEISQAGSVPELQVTNDLDVMVYLMDGQELVGAKQNRILNTDVLVPAKAGLKIPVSCVEAGRWDQLTVTFSGGKSASHRIRAAKAARVHDSLKRDQRHDADQGAVWEEVQASMVSSNTFSPTRALNDAYSQRKSELDGFRGNLTMPPEAVGLAVFHDGKFQGLDLFDRHSTLQYFWESLIDSYAIDFLSAADTPEGSKGKSEAATIQSALNRAVAGKWERFNSPGAGQDWRWQGARLTGSALVWDEKVVVHLQLFPKQPGSGSAAQARRPRIHRRYGGSSSPGTIY